MTMDLRPIGFVRSPYPAMSDAPHQGRESEQESEIVIDEQFAAGLRDIEHHPHLIVLCWFDRADRSKLTATPPHLSTGHGVFGRVLRVRGLDAINMTPVLDIKPYSRGIDCVQEKKNGGTDRTT